MTDPRLAKRLEMWVPLLACLSACALPWPNQGTDVTRGDQVISGHVVDPHGLRPDGAILMLGRESDRAFSSVPVPVAPDGSFRTPPLSPATYVLEVVRTPHSRTHAATVVGFSIVPLGTSDVSGVTVSIRRDTALNGRFRMESDNPAAPWPPHIVVNAFLALDGMPLLNGTGAEGAPDGRFILRNAFGPRVLRCGYTLAPGNPWWPARVLLDGVDITNVPTDFSTHEDGQLEVFFTQHPARLTGTVTDGHGQPLPNAWVLRFSEDRALWQEWAETSDAVRSDAQGRFRFVSLPGRYLVGAVASSTFSSKPSALKQIGRVAPRAVPVELGEREVKTLQLTVERPVERAPRHDDCP